MKGGLSEMDCKYILIRDTYSDDNGNHTGYGIVAVDHESKIVSAATDLSCNKDEVARLVQMCNELELSLVHFQDVVEDFLN